MIDVKKYLGIPFKVGGRGFDGADCWGLVCLVYENEYGILLPAFDGYKDHTTAEVYVARGLDELCAKRIVKPEEGDIVLMRIAGRVSHVGVYIDSGKVLHIMRGCESVIEPIDKLAVGKVYGYFRV